MSNVLFVCVHNAGRSQIAAALLARQAGERHQARSAGSQPARAVHPEVVASMHELGVHLAGRTPRALTGDDAAWADVVVTMGCGDACPVLPGRRRLDWDLPDPAGRPADEVRALRDRIERLVAELVRELDGADGDSAPRRKA